MGTTAESLGATIYADAIERLEDALDGLDETKRRIVLRVVADHTALGARALLGEDVSEQMADTKAQLLLLGRALARKVRAEIAAAFAAALKTGLDWLAEFGGKAAVAALVSLAGRRR